MSLLVFFKKQSYPYGPAVAVAGCGAASRCRCVCYCGGLLLSTRGVAACTTAYCCRHPMLLPLRALLLLACCPSRCCLSLPAATTAAAHCPCRCCCVYLGAGHGSVEKEFREGEGEKKENRKEESLHVGPTCN